MLRVSQAARGGASRRALGRTKRSGKPTEIGVHHTFPVAPPLTRTAPDPGLSQGRVDRLGRDVQHTDRSPSRLADGRSGTDKPAIPSRMSTWSAMWSASRSSGSCTAPTVSFARARRARRCSRRRSLDRDGPCKHQRSLAATKRLDGYAGSGQGVPAPRFAADVTRDTPARAPAGSAAACRSSVQPSPDRWQVAVADVHTIQHRFVTRNEPNGPPGSSREPGVVSARSHSTATGPLRGRDVCVPTE